MATMSSLIVFFTSAIVDLLLPLLEHTSNLIFPSIGGYLITLDVDKTSKKKI